MSGHAKFPVTPKAAHEVVRAQLDDSEPPRPDDLRLAACACLRSGNPEYQADGAALLAAVADENARDVQSALYDLAAVLDAPDRRTRVHAMAAFQVAAIAHPDTAVDLLNAVVPRLTDIDPLVREAAASTVAWLAEAVRDDTRVDFPDGTRAAFQPAVSALLAVLGADTGDERFEWTAAFAVTHPTRTFWGAVDAGASRRSAGHWQATFAVAMLADWFPEQVATHDTQLATLAESGARAETRWYAIDALARAGADDALRTVRDRALAALEKPDRAASSVETLYHLTTERPALLVPAAPSLANALDDLDPEPTTLAVVTILHAAVHDPDPVAVDTLVREWLRTANEDDSRTKRVNVDLVASVATAHPEQVLPAVGHALDIPLADHALAADAERPTQSTQSGEGWDTDRAWRVLLEIASRDRELVWEVVKEDWLLARLDQQADRGARIRKLYATTVPTPPPESAIEALFKLLIADTTGAYAALSTLQDRAPDTVLAAAVDAVDGASAPVADVLSVLVALSDDYPAALEPLQETLWSWNNTIQPSDDRWSDLVTILGRIAVATDDRERLSRMLHLEHAVYCKRFLRSAVAPTVIQTAPNKAVPALLEHLEHRDGALRKQVVRLFETRPDGYGGWAPTIQGAVLARMTDSDPGVRSATVETLGTWLEYLTETSGDARDGWVSPVRSALFDGLDDEDWRVRAHAARALGADVDAETQATLETRLAQEGNQTVRFEIQRVLSRHSREASTDR